MSLDECFQARISSQWLSELRQVMMSVPRQIVCKLISLRVFTLWQNSIVGLFDFIGSKVHAYLAVTCHLHFWQNSQCLFHATAVTGEMDGYGNNWIRVSTESVLWKRRFYCHACWGPNLWPFNHRSGALPLGHLMIAAVWSVCLCRIISSPLTFLCTTHLHAHL